METRVTSFPVHRSILVLDMEKSTGPGRTNPIKGELRFQIHSLLMQAMEYAGITLKSCDPFEDRGDGWMVLVRPDDDIPKIFLISRLIPQLSRLLCAYNAELPLPERSRRSIRLRAAVHAGEVHHDARCSGYFGEALEVACRLVDSPRLKRSLHQATAASLALVVSEDIYWSVIRHEYDGVLSCTYNECVRINVGGRTLTGWVHLPNPSPAMVPPLVAPMAPFMPPATEAV